MRVLPLLLLAAVLSGQTERGAIEVSASTGLTMRPGLHPQVMGGMAVAIWSRLIVGADISFTSVGGDVLRPGSFPFLNAVTVSQSRALEFNAIVQVPLSQRGRVEPYLLGGGGVVGSSFTGTNARFGQLYTGRHSDSSAVAVVGGGVRVFVGRRWGIRTDLRVFAPDPFVRASAGVFVQSR